MPLEAGARIGHYEILALAGAGGMGEVYRARDTVLKRDVALKVLPTALSRDPDRLGRFQREAEILASLNHPGIAIIHGMAAEGELRAIVMEFVEGETLRGPLPLDTVLNYARQIIDALEYAHDRGVIHRDLKPGNVKITAEGQVKLLDFGLAKAIEDPAPAANPADSPTLTLGHTRAGAILGTAAYMSPEQAVGKPADRRSDIFSFGSVLYEMLAGERAFRGDSGPEILVAVASTEPDWGKLPAETPEWLLGLLRRCLVKDRRQRLQAIGEARLVLENPGSGAESPAQAKSLPHGVAWVSAAVALLVGAGAAWFLKPAPPPEPRTVMHLTAPLPPDTGANGVVLSRDGSHLAVNVQRGPKAPTPPILLRGPDQPGFRAVPGTEDASLPAFSPDNQWIVFFAPPQSGDSQSGGRSRLLKKMRIAGGPALTLAEVSGVNTAYVSWGEDDNILFATQEGLMSVPSTGGQPKVVASYAAGERNYAFPQLLPGGKVILASALTAQGGARAWAYAPATDVRKTLVEGGRLPQFVPSGLEAGYVLYADGGALFAAPLDLKRLQAGPAVPVLEGVLTLPPGVASVGFSVSRTGTLAYVPGREVEVRTSTLVWVDRQGREQPVSAPPRIYSGGPQLSPDGGRVALMISDSSAIERSSQIWVYDLARGASTRVAAEGIDPVWTPDGKRLIYGWQPGERQSQSKKTAEQDSDVAAPSLLSAPADGDGRSTVLLKEPLTPLSVSRDGALLVVPTNRRFGRGGMLLMNLVPGSPGDSRPRPFREGQGPLAAEFSPDGRWVAYQSAESGRQEIYAVPFDGSGERVTVSTSGGNMPRWARNGRELFYLSLDRKMMAVDVAAGPAFRPGTPRVLFENAEPYDVAPDGRFLMLKRASQEAAREQPAELHVIVNWIEELRRRVPPLK
jgi:serine/threonine-protein kinase